MTLTRATVLMTWATLALSACSEQAAEPPVRAGAILEVATAGSAEPHLATAPDGTVILSWLEPRDGKSLLRYSTLKGREWSSPRTVASGENWFVNWADFPSVVAIDESLWAAHWLVKAAEGTYEYDVAVALSTDGGRTWQPPIRPHTDGTLSEHGFASLYPMPGGVGVLWLDGRETVTGGGMTLRSAVVSPDAGVQSGQLADGFVCDCCQTDVAIGPQGPIAVYRDRTEDEIRDIYVSRMIDGRWEDGRPVGNDGWEIHGCPVNGPAIATRGDSAAVVWFTAANNDPIVKLAFSADGAQTFGAPILVDTDWPVGRVGVVLVDSTAAIVSWLRQGEGGIGEVMARAVYADGRLGPARLIDTTLAGRLSGFPQIAARGDDIVFAWTGTGNGQKQVRSALHPASSFLAADAPVGAAAPGACPSAEGLAVQVLGSGGPIADDARASSSYLVWKDGKPRLLIDAGGGSFLRFGEAGGTFTDLDFIGLSHFHADHSADFPALLKSGYFSGRERPLPVVGPSGSGPFPGMLALLDSLLGDGGAFAYLGGYLDGTGGLAKLDPLEVDISNSEPARVFENERFGIDALPVPHGIVPALAFRVASSRESIVFSSDQTLASPDYADFARNASLLVLHMALPEGATSGTTLHATPGRIGEFATEADARAVLLSHFMARSLQDLDRNTGLVRDGYAGEVIVAEDLLCVTVGR